MLGAFDTGESFHFYPNKKRKANQHPTLCFAAAHPPLTIITNNAVPICLYFVYYRWGFRRRRNVDWRIELFTRRQTQTGYRTNALWTSPQGTRRGHSTCIWKRECAIKNILFLLKWMEKQPISAVMVIWLSFHLSTRVVPALDQQTSGPAVKPNSTHDYLLSIIALFRQS